MKKYRLLKAGEAIQAGDEDFFGKWSPIGSDDNLIEQEVDESNEGLLRRPVPHTGRVQFLMEMSIVVAVTVDCDGMEQEDIEDEAGRLAVDKILSEPSQYIHMENIDWDRCKMDNEARPNEPQ